MTRIRLIYSFLGIFCVVTFHPPAFGHTSIHSQAAQERPVEVAGKWEVSWQVRLGTTQNALELHEDGTTLSGTFQDLHGASPVKGTVDGKKISFDVPFTGKRPYTIRFTGTVDGDKIAGTSQLVNADGGAGGAYLGHGGEVAQPEHPWTAKRVVEPGKQPETSAANNPVKK